MRNIYTILCFIIITSCMGQRGIITVQQKKRPPVVQPPSVNNQIKEIEYFNAYLLPLASKANIQTALNTYGIIRLQAGDYRGVNLTIGSGQKIYGHPKGSQIGNITVSAGSSGVHLENLIFSDNTLTFAAGSPITNSTFNTLRYVLVTGTNVQMTGNQLVNIQGAIRLNCSSSGYLRNNKIIKHQAQSISNQLVMKGNSTTPSYGNVNLHSNYLTPNGDATDIDGLQYATFVGVDSEGWNLTGEGSKAMFYAKNMGDLKITNFGGGNAYSAVKTGAFDIGAQNLFFFDKYLQNSADAIAKTTNMYLINGEGSYTRTGTGTDGFSLIGNNNSTNYVSWNGAEQSSTITDPTTISTITSTLLGVQRTPWTKPVWETLPNPSGTSWSGDRAGKTDSRAYIQNLIDTNGIADLPAGTYYIGSTLNVPLDDNHGIIGQGTGKTVIIGLTDTFPLITLGYGSTKSFTLSNITLQGGSVGVYSAVTASQIAYASLKYVIFRNQTYGIQLRRIMGLDNNFLDHVSFIDCGTGIFQDPLTPYANDLDTSSYVDKTMFYESQFINCGKAFSMQATRPNNLNAWVGCKFSGGQQALYMGGQNYPIVANCEFSGYTGTHVIESNTISIYSSKFSSNTPSASMINAMFTHIEGSDFLDSAKMFVPVMYNSTFQYILNSTITGDVAVPKPSNLYYESSSIYANSLLLANSTKNKLLVNVKAGVSTVVINAVPTPYPQLLVTH